MSKNIAISDDVYRKLKREKGDRSFSDVIRDHLDDNRTLQDVTGAGIFGEESYEMIKADIEELSRGTLSRLDDETV
ncbi:MAG: antitoxin VapB family protein [Halohasta sp.]